MGNVQMTDTKRLRQAIADIERPHNDAGSLAHTVEHHWPTIRAFIEKALAGIDPLIIERLERELADYEEAMKDKRRLTREIDVALHGEQDAAEQASLCDLIPLAALARSRAEEAEAQVAAMRGALSFIRNNWAGHSPACNGGLDDKCDCDWPVVRDKCDAALSTDAGEKMLAVVEAAQVVVLRAEKPE